MRIKNQSMKNTRTLTSEKSEIKVDKVSRKVKKRKRNSLVTTPDFHGKRRLILFYPYDIYSENISVHAHVYFRCTVRERLETITTSRRSKQ